MTRAWDHRISNSDMGVRVVGPLDIDDLRTFDCVGSTETPSAVEVRDFIRAAPWLKEGDGAVGWQFGWGDAVVGYAVIRYWPFPHPGHASLDERPYVYVQVLAIDKDFQGQRDRVSGEKLWSVMMRGIEELAARFIPVDGREPLGIYGIVREDNMPARHVLEHSGYSPDPAGPFRDSGTRHRSLVFRKPRASWREAS
jgi:hypothetical protein